ncbi:peptidase inhibitor family I36 protein [Micromonospora sp. CPCC 205539]|uniref:peptidase inhibitor family I36 protein n=1 Tax=Micromonospora sp. CPCC 205539 TaxID=3122408 RepID=UPI002FEED3E3
MTTIPIRFRGPVAGRLLTALLTGLLAVAVGAPAASAAPPANAQDKLQSEISAHIKAYGGKQISVNQIAWEDGVTMTFPLPGAKVALAPGQEMVPLGTPNCRRGWSCLWEHNNFEGRYVDYYNCGTVWLRDKGFENMASSWHNNQTGGAYSIVYNYVGSNPQQIWFEPAGASAAYVGNGNNDIADSVHVC